MDSEKTFYYEFGNYRLDPANQLLLRGEEVVPLAPKLFEMLHLLVENGGQTLSKESFLSKLWTDTFVEESNLTQYIFHLRKILQQNSNGTVFIETLPKRGYRFVAPVKLIANESFSGNSVQNSEDKIFEETNQNEKSIPKTVKTNFVQKTRWKSALAFALISTFVVSMFFAIYLWQAKSDLSKAKNSSNRSIAVLPFKQIGSKNADEQLQIGMTDALITKLSNLKQIQVRPTSSVFQIKQSEPLEIGRELKVDTILDGTIQQTDDVIRVTVQLTNVQDGTTIWAKKFDTATKNIFDIQDNISEQVSLSFVSQLNETENRQINKRYTNSLEAYEAYSRGRYFLEMSSRKDLSKSIEYFQQAIKLDPQYALAYSGLADLQIFIASNYTGTPTAIENQKLAKVNALKALEIDDTLAEPHTTLAVVIFEESGDWVAAEKEFLKSIELNSNNSVAHNWYALHLIAQGDFDKAEVEMKKALEIDPVSPSMNAALGQIYYFGKQYELAIAQFEKSVELDLKFNTANIYLALSLEAIGKKEQALALLQEILNDYPKYTPAKTALGCIYADIGNQSQARGILEYLEKMKTPSVYEKYGIALINAHLGNKEKSLAMLEKISTFRNLNMMIRFKFDPRLDILRQDKRFETIFNNNPFAN